MPNIYMNGPLIFYHLKFVNEKLVYIILGTCLNTFVKSGSYTTTH